MQSAPMMTVTPADASTPIEEDLVGKVAVIDRGGVLYVEKAKRAQDKGAIAVIIVNSDNEPIDKTWMDLRGDTTTPGSEEISIYVCGVSKSTGDALKACLGWHCRVEPKAGDRIPGMKYDTLVPEDIEPDLNGRSKEDLKVGDEISFGERDEVITPESLVGLRVKATNKGTSFAGTLRSFDSSTGEHECVFDNEVKQFVDILGDKVRMGDKVWTRSECYSEPFEFEGAEAYCTHDRRGVCIIRELGQDGLATFTRRTYPLGDLFMPFLTDLDLSSNGSLTGEARW